LSLPASSLRDTLSQKLEEIERYGIGRLLGEYPAFLALLLDKLRQADAAGLFNDIPGMGDKLAGLLWDGVSFQANRSEEIRSLLEKLDRRFRGNIEASDSFFRCHFIAEEGKIRGGSGLLHFKDEDFRFMGSTDVLIELLTGDLFMGLGNLGLQTAGHPGWIGRIAPVMRGIGRLLKGA
jgi:hypothetical protein